MESLLRQPTFKENFRQWFKAVAAGSVKEGLREEAPTCRTSFSTRCVPLR